MAFEIERICSHTELGAEQLIGYLPGDVSLQSLLVLWPSNLLVLNFQQSMGPWNFQGCWCVFHVTLARFVHEGTFSEALRNSGTRPLLSPPPVVDDGRSLLRLMSVMSSRRPRWKFGCLNSHQTLGSCLPLVAAVPRLCPPAPRLGTAG